MEIHRQLADESTDRILAQLDTFFEESTCDRIAVLTNLLKTCTSPGACKDDPDGISEIINHVTDIVNFLLKMEEENDFRNRYSLNK